MHNMKSAILEFNPAFNKFGKDKELRQGLSAVVRIDKTLWVANDETISLERLSFQGKDGTDVYKYGDHEQFSLNDYLSLPVPPPGEEEADVEGLDYKDGYLWLVGSHSLKRKKSDKKDSVEDNFKHLAKVSSDGNRYILARIPVVKEAGTYTLQKEADQNGKKRTAAQLSGNSTGNALTEVLAQDKHLQQFFVIPSKDNGFDIEGLAVGDSNRIFLGLRGPVLRGWAIILELQLEACAENHSELKLKSINPNNPHNPANPTYRKHFLDLGGLGIRDLCVQGSDLLILAGPTMELDGPITIFRWKGGAEPNEESLVSLGGALQKVTDVPYGWGEDHAEGMTLFPLDGSQARSVLVVYDVASEARQVGGSAVKANVFALPS